MKMEKLSNINFELFCGSNITGDQPNVKYLCNSIPELLNVIEDPAQRVHTYCIITCSTLPQAVDYDNYASNTKYCLAQLLHDQLETELGQSLMKATTMRELW